jgi:hypothetical protein
MSRSYFLLAAAVSLTCSVPLGAKPKPQPKPPQPLFGSAAPTLQRASSALELLPAPGEKVQELRPLVQVSWPQGVLAGAKCRLYFNGRDVSADCLRNDSFLSYRPFAAPAAGPVSVRFVSEDTQGLPVEKTWSFDMAEQKLIREVSHNADPGGAGLFEHDQLVVTCKAAPRGKAQVIVPGWEPLAMKETEPGVYQATHRVRTSDSALQQPLKVVYQLDGHREEQTATTPVKVFGGLYKVRVLSPADGSKVDQNFTLVGQAKPGAKVSVIPKIGFGSDGQAPTTTSSRIGSTAGSIPVEVDEEGNFKLDYGLPVLLPGMGVVFTVYSVDDDGSRSMGTVVRYNFK